VHTMAEVHNDNDANVTDVLHLDKASTPDG